MNIEKNIIEIIRNPKYPSNRLLELAEGFLDLKVDIVYKSLYYIAK